MSISFIELMNYIKKHIALILVSMILCGIFGELYYRRAQKYYSSTTVKYTFDNAESGVNPKGEALDAYEMVSPAVIEKALAALNIGEGMESIRSSTTITPFIDDATKQKQEAMLKQGEEFEYFPTKYTVTFINGEKEGADYGVKVLNRLFEAYDEYIRETYTNMGKIPDIFSNIDYDKYDYMEICSLYEQQLDTVLDMLTGYASQNESFRSTKTGLTFNDLKVYFSGIRNTEYAKFHSLVRSACLSKNEEVLLKNYRYKVEQLESEYVKKTEESNVSFGIMTDFYKQYQKGIAFENWQEGSGNKNNNILYDIDETNKKTTYDEIVSKYVDSGVEAENAKKDIEYYNRLIQDYTQSNLTEEQKAVYKAEAEQLINQIDKSLKNYISVANETLNDYNVYKGTNYISYLSSVSVDAKLSRVVTLAFALVAGAFMGMMLALGVEIVKKLAEEEKLKDKRKKLHMLEKGVLPKDMENMPPLDRALFEAVSDELKEFYLLYQPIVDRNGAWVGVETFVRWSSKDFGTIMPADFIKIAEKYDVMEILGKWILREACAKCKAWNSEFGLELFVSVNFTLNQVSSRIFMDEILSALNEVKLNPKHLILEVSSGIDTEDNDVIAKKLSAIKTFGVGIAVDDFDEGVKDAEELTSLPIDIVKAEQSNIENTDILRVSKYADFKVCAQRVENRESADRLCELGVEYMQGFYFSKPLSEEQLVQEMKNKSKSVR